MGCSTSNPVVMDTPKEQLSILSTKDHKNAENAIEHAQDEDITTKTYPASEAFVIPLDDDAETKHYMSGASKTSTINKKPPKRIQALMEQAEKSEPAKNLEDLEKKLNDAELRRKEYLQQKIENVHRTRQSLLRSVEADATEEGVETVERQNTYASEIKAKALDDDSKRELLSATMKS